MNIVTWTERCTVRNGNNEIKSNNNNGGKKLKIETASNSSNRGDSAAGTVLSRS